MTKHSSEGSFMEAEEFKIVEVSPVKKLKYCLIGLPDVGLVGLITVNHIIGAFNPSEVGHLESDSLPPVLVIHNGAPKSPIRIFVKNDVAILTSEIPIPQTAIPALSRKIVEWSKSKDVELLISVGGIGIPNRLEIETPEVYGVASSEPVKEVLTKSKILLLEEGFMVGPHAAILKDSIKNGLNNLVMMAQSHYKYPDPGAAAVTITAINKLLRLDINTKSLLDQAEDIRIKLRELMQRTNKQIESTQKTQEQELPPMYV